MPWHGAAATLAPVTIAAPILMACLLAAAGRVLPRPLVDALAALSAAGVVAVDVVLLRATSGGRVVSWAGGWTPKGGTGVGIALVADRMGAGLALLAATLVLLSLIYSWRYFDDVHAHYHAMVLLFLAGMSGFALSGDVFDLFVFFELMGTVAYGLAGFKIEDPTSVQGALNFGIVNSLGAYLSLFGIGILYARFGALGLPQLSAAMAGQRPDVLVVAAFCLICTGLLVKAAMVPFHFWLADAHAVAPTPVCILFSGVMVELGVYGVARLYWTTFSDVLPADAVRRALLVLGVLTGLLGSLMCVLQRHLKRLLAYSTIAHVGLFLVAVGTLDAAGTTGAAVYVLGHAGVKAALFLLAGLVLNRYGSVDELTLHGRGRHARVLPWLFLLAALGLAGLPPFGTGLGKAISEAALGASGHRWGTALFVLVSALTGGAVLRAGARIYFGLGPAPPPRKDGPETTGDEERPETRALPRARATMLAPIVLLLAGSLAVGSVPGVAGAASQAAGEFLDRNGYAAQALQAAPPSVPAVLHEARWTPAGVWLGLLSALLAVGVAALALWRPFLPRPPDALRLPFERLITAIRQVHSGHVGDYVAWLFLGVGAFTSLVGFSLL